LEQHRFAMHRHQACAVQRRQQLAGLAHTAAGVDRRDNLVSLPEHGKGADRAWVSRNIPISFTLAPRAEQFYMAVYSYSISPPAAFRLPQRRPNAGGMYSLPTGAKSVHLDRLNGF
jgi:hypothetical protein